MTIPTLDRTIEMLPPAPFPTFARKEFVDLRNELAELRREVADLKTGYDLLLEQIANLRAAVHRIEHATGTLPMEYIGLAVTAETDLPASKPVGAL